MIKFAKRSRRDDTDVADRRIWSSLCQRYRIVESRPRYGPRRGKGAEPVRYYAQGLYKWGWGRISQHRLKARAIKACRDDAAATATGR